MSNPASPTMAGGAFRIALFAAAASLAAYIAYQYSTQPHATQGLSGVLFPLSGVLAAAGMLLAWQPRKACDCSAGVRSGIGLLAGLWLVAGVACVPSLAATVATNPAGGLLATFHMFAQHVFLSAALLAFAVAPRPMAAALGADGAPDRRDSQGAGRILSSR